MDYADLVNKELHKIFSDEEPEMAPLVRYQLFSGGKRLRPTLCLLVCQSLGGKIRDALPYGLAVEILHNLSLILDDIIDKDTLRRGKKPLYLAYDIPAALMTANYLTYRAFEIFSPKANPRALRELAYAAKMTCLGEKVEGETRFEEKEYLRLCKLKTAHQFSVSSTLGALAARKGKKIVEAARLLGRNIGMAFQIQDDILNFEGEESQFGKPIGGDARERRPNYVLVCAYKKLGEKLFEGDFMENIRNTGAIEEARKKACEFMEAAKSSLSAFPKNAYSKRLSLLINNAVERAV